MARELIRFQDYSRSEVHDIFSPETKFVRGAGSWGILGIVRIPTQPGDFVFFVTFGQKQGHHEFEESVTEEGILTWQSQPEQRLSDPQILQLIKHDETKNTIYLFLRTAEEKPYTFMGTLGHPNHDPNRAQPVFFEWQIMEWRVPPTAVLSRMGLRLEPAETVKPLAITGVTNALIMRPPPQGKTVDGIAKSSLMGNKKPDYAKRDAQNRKLGRAGELLVVTYEISRLTHNGRPDLASLVTHVAADEGDNAGYDVRSFDDDGHVKFIEVKTTKGGPLTRTCGLTIDKVVDFTGLMSLGRVLC
jgi:hypothetical protein